MVRLEGKEGRSVLWEPGRLAARSGGVEVYRVEQMELRKGDRVRWTRNDLESGLVNSQTAEVASRERWPRDLPSRGWAHPRHGPRNDPQLRHVDRAWASTVHAFQGRTVDTVIAAMEANHPNLTNQKTLYVKISRARDRAELVTDDAGALRERLEAATGERIAALEALGGGEVKSKEAGAEASRDVERPREALQPEERRTPGIEKAWASREIGMEL